MRYFKVIASIWFLVSCHNDDNSGRDTANDTDTIKNYDTGTSGPEESLSSCYESTNGRDTVFLNVFGSSKIITGALNYRYAEKDNSNGTLRGVMHGDTLIADYIFMSEGKVSVRQVAFLKKGDNFIEGYGDVKELDAKMVFKNIHTISFTGFRLHEVDCNSND